MEEAVHALQSKIPHTVHTVVVLAQSGIHRAFDQAGQVNDEEHPRILV